ncbi:hypothetical protein ACO1ZR_27760, partial [Klebsiella quasipneumoniae]
GFAENTDDLFVGKTLLHGDVLMWLMKTLLTSGCTNQRGAGHHSFIKIIDKILSPPSDTSTSNDSLSPEAGSDILA